MKSISKLLVRELKDELKKRDIEFAESDKKQELLQVSFQRFKMKSSPFCIAFYFICKNIISYRKPQIPQRVNYIGKSGNIFYSYNVKFDLCRTYAINSDVCSTF